ncbi:MAG: hypothetical protein AAGC55_01550 [Myxococcota bacterium]
MPRCQVDVECGEGFLCGEGQCQKIISSEGDTCIREQDCGPGQACRFETSGRDEDGFLSEGACRGENPGGTTGNECLENGDCRNGICAGGLCTQLCVEDLDCPAPFSCALIVVSDDDNDVDTVKFFGCYPVPSFIVPPP